MKGQTRRQFAIGSALLMARPALATIKSWQDVSDRAQSLGQLHSILIHQNASEVLAVRFRGPQIGRAVPIKSVSKTIVAALTGSALDRDELPSLRATLGEVAPRLVPRAADPRAADITIEQLVTMQAGLERTSGRNYGGWISSSNWVSDALSRPFVAEPGERMLYSTGSYHILGAVLSEVSGQSLLSLARERLGAPLEIDIPAWTRDPQGRYLGGNEMAMSLGAMVRFAELYRQNGVWNGTMVLNADWVTRSFQPRTRSPFSGLNYGYGWFLGQAQSEDFALARGYGGQLICVVPSLDLTVAITSDPNKPARSGGYFGDLMGLISETIIPVAKLSVT